MYIDFLIDVFPLFDLIVLIEFLDIMRAHYALYPFSLLITLLQVKSACFDFN